MLAAVGQGSSSSVIPLFAPKSRGAFLPPGQFNGDVRGQVWCLTTNIASDLMFPCSQEYPPPNPACLRSGYKEADREGLRTCIRTWHFKGQEILLFLIFFRVFFIAVTFLFVSSHSSISHKGSFFLCCSLLLFSNIPGCLPLSSLLFIIICLCPSPSLLWSLFSGAYLVISSCSLQQWYLCLDTYFYSPSSFLPILFIRFL